MNQHQKVFLVLSSGVRACAREREKEREKERERHTQRETEREKEKKKIHFVLRLFTKTDFIWLCFFVKNAAADASFLVL